MCRTIANMDIKLDFVPPSLINFISRQLVGSGFRLYQKIVSSATEGNEDFHEALGDHYILEYVKLCVQMQNQQKLWDWKNSRLMMHALMQRSIWLKLFKQM
ncbi:hypothetical protein CK203_047236 [Vitis vinifera]|uniref:Uncharacterized protein n=1 Tax=Vitis vinifera TaxID=29760 RepID=A0A438HZ48_VITVI|nr:hypothetical protein CK203_047236 [Vitis vinifera]